MMKGLLHLAVFSLVFSFVMLAGGVEFAGATSLASPCILNGGINFGAWTEDAPVRPSVKQGIYRVNGRTIYIGIEAEPPDHPAVQFYDEKTRRTGTLEHISGHKYRTKDSPTMTFLLDSPISPIMEKPFVILNGADHLGASLSLPLGAGKHPTIVLIHGADDETREMGFLIPYFVSFGLNVVTYDQRGTSESTGNWQFTGPESKADDVIAIIQRIKSDPAVDPERIGVWGLATAVGLHRSLRYALPLRS
jgi:pimeloyl-ACP methyl ester carboxylesterase